ncbi:MAG TPA: TonB family protein [Novosphingobium sp.]|nr:TonB family protein [Novosphingobium sp.]
MTILLLVAALSVAPSTEGARTVGEAMEILARKVVPRGAFPMGNPGEWIGPEDYPTTAYMDQAEGAVSFQLKVDPQGRVSECTVTVSSGVAALDDTACNLITLRAVFDPARDRKGKPVWGTYANRVVWKMTDPVPLPQPMEAVTSFIVEPDGTVSGCELKAPELPGEQVEKAMRMCVAGHYQPYLGSDGEPVRRRFRATTRIEIEPVE